MKIGNSRDEDEAFFRVALRHTRLRPGFAPLARARANVAAQDAYVERCATMPSASREPRHSRRTETRQSPRGRAPGSHETSRRRRPSALRRGESRVARRARARVRVEVREPRARGPRVAVPRDRLDRRRRDPSSLGRVSDVARAFPGRVLRLVSRGAARAGDVGRRAPALRGRSRMGEARAPRTRACAAAFRRGRASTEQSDVVRKVLGANRRERLDANLRHEAERSAERRRERARKIKITARCLQKKELRRDEGRLKGVASETRDDRSRERCRVPAMDS